MNSAPSAAMNIWQPRIREKNTELPQDFVPTPYTVHIGRGKMCSDATGNRRLKVIVDSFLGEYKKASNKMEKSVIVSKIVDIIHDACPVGAFVKFQKGKWWEVGDYAAREKVGSMLRDALSEKYRSSSKAKLARRKQAKDEVYEAAKSNVINAILSIKHEDISDSDDDDEEKGTPKKESSKSSQSCPNTPTKKKLSSTQTQKLHDLKQDKAMEFSATTTVGQMSNCAPIQISSFHDMNYNGNSTVGFQWYGL